MPSYNKFYISKDKCHPHDHYLDEVIFLDKDMKLCQLNCIKDNYPIILNNLTRPIMLAMAVIFLSKNMSICQKITVFYGYLGTFLGMLYYADLHDNIGLNCSRKNIVYKETKCEDEENIYLGANPYESSEYEKYFPLLAEYLCNYDLIDHI